MYMTNEPGVTASLVARRHWVAPNLLFNWRRLAARGALTVAGSEEEVVAASRGNNSGSLSLAGASIWNRGSNLSSATITSKPVVMMRIDRNPL